MDSSGIDGQGGIKTDLGGKYEISDGVSLWGRVSAWFVYPQCFTSGVTDVFIWLEEFRETLYPKCCLSCRCVQIFGGICQELFWINEEFSML